VNAGEETRQKLKQHLVSHKNFFSHPPCFNIFLLKPNPLYKFDPFTTGAYVSMASASMKICSPLQQFPEQ